LKESKFGTCLNCIDGRAHLPVIQWIKREYGLDYVDMITEAGMDGVLAGDNRDITSIIEKINVSLDKHKSETIFVVGHFDCAGNLVDSKTHKENISSAVNKLKKLKPHCKVTGLWISDKWEVERITG